MQVGAWHGARLEHVAVVARLVGQPLAACMATAGVQGRRGQAPCIGCVIGVLGNNFLTDDATPVCVTHGSREQRR